MLVSLIDGLFIFYIIFYLSLFILPLFNISNISGPTIGLVFLCCLRYKINKNNFFENPFMRTLRNISRLSDKTLLSILILIIFLTLSILSITRHLSFSSGSSDLGIFDQAIWNTAQGNILFSSLKGNINLLGDHFEPILLVIAPLYKIWPSALVLLILQSFLLAFAIVPLYLIASKILKSRFLIFVFIVSYILSEAMRGVALSDFHPECFILLFLFWAYYFLLQKKNLWLFFVTFLLLLCKEDTAFLISGLGIFALFFQKRFKTGAALFIIGIAAWALQTKFIIPYFNPAGKYSYMDRFPFGLTYADNLRAVLGDPSLLVKLLFQKAKIIYCLKLLGPVVFLPLLSPAHYILVAIPLFKNLLLAHINFSGFYDITSHYTAGIIPFIYIGAIYGAGWLARKLHLRKAALFIGGFALLSSLFFYGKTDGYQLARFTEGIKNNHSIEKLSYLRLVPAEASVATNFNIVPHLSHRKYIFEWNPNSRMSKITEYLVIDMDLLEYLSPSDIANIAPYFAEIKNMGYRKVFSSPDGKFLIFHNPAIDKSLVERVSFTP
ncbi:MAG: DUF2079 domain-containing protein [Candidatus Omnitrophica bacterium]|nr:DUF2079 domain-containing protein [Candidatus Omnitrophota bacterium]